MKITRHLILILILILCILSLGCSVDQKIQSVSTDDALTVNKEPEVEKSEPQLPEKVEVTLTAVGDIMVHGPQLKAQFNQESGEYNFVNNFKFVKRYIEASDLSFCNLETTLAGEEKKYSSYPRFNTPDAIAHALKDTGFDIIVTANNHTIDTDAFGVYRTLAVLKDLGLMPLGTKEREDADSFVIKDVKGIKFGMIAYTYETPQYLGKRTLNALVIPTEVENKINTFNYDTLDKSLANMKEEIDKMKSLGSEVIVVYIHWGDENQLKPNEYQRRIATTLADYGVDIILGSHPHVIQPIEIIESPTTHKKTLVAYSLGNFISNQRYEILKNRYTEDGMILNVSIEKDFESNSINFSKITYIPTWVNKYYDGKNVYEIVPLNDDDESLKTFNILSEGQLWRAQNSRKNTMEIIESDMIEILEEGSLQK